MTTDAAEGPLRNKGDHLRSNVVRALRHTAAFACLTGALLLYGADRIAAGQPR
ncbi:hypothetical protein ACIRD8_36740 [Streptomyces sp. NPDC102451]|uniref:hypothetical protein n=1 Tax=Streptomyces sp. NPDC102451 TaxID=3366177 RepID=UPI00380ABD82